MRQTNFLSGTESLNSPNLLRGQTGGLLTVKVTRSRTQSENIVSNFDDSHSQTYQRSDPKVDLAKGGFDMVVKDTLYFRLFSNEDCGSQSMYSE